MIFGILYALVALVMFAVASVSMAKQMIEHNMSGSLDNLFITGLLSALVALIWPLSMFGISFTYIYRHYKRKADRERYITQELSRG